MFYELICPVCRDSVVVDSEAELPLPEEAALCASGYRAVMKKSVRCMDPRCPGENDILAAVPLGRITKLDPVVLAPYFRRGWILFYANADGSPAAYKWDGKLDPARWIQFVLKTHETEVRRSAIKNACNPVHSKALQNMEEQLRLLEDARTALQEKSSCCLGH